MLKGLRSLAHSIAAQAKRGASGSCPWLWTHAFIDSAGRVFTCCHAKPGELGNIRTQHLAAIWSESLALRSFKRMSSRGTLPCLPPCTLLSPEDKSRPAPPECPLHPLNLWILYGEACNLRCTMCRQDHRSRVMLDNETLKRHVDWEKLGTIELQGGEVLAMPKAKELYLWLTQTMRKKVEIITNGMLIDARWAEHIVWGSNWVQISVNAATKQTHERVNTGSNFEKVIEAVRTLVRLSRAEGGRCAIWYKYTVVPENAHEIADAIALADSLGCTQIEYGYDASVPAFLRAHPELVSSLRAALAAAVEAHGRTLRISVNRLRHLGLL